MTFNNRYLAVFVELPADNLSILFCSLSRICSRICRWPSPYHDIPSLPYLICPPSPIRPHQMSF